MTKIRFTLTAAAIIAALTLCGCTEQKTDYNYDLIGGELNSDNEYTVDIRKDDKDASDDTSSSSDISVADDTNSLDEQKPTTSDAPSAPTSEPEVSASSSGTEASTPSVQPAAPAQSSQQTETSEPTSDAATSETSKPIASEKKDTTSNTTQNYDANGFPANPAPLTSFQDSSGQWWIYNPIFGWGEYDGSGKTNMEDWSFDYNPNREQILF